MRPGEKNHTMITLLQAILTADDGEDLIEYTLLFSFLDQSVVGVLAWNKHRGGGVLAGLTPGWDDGGAGHLCHARRTRAAAAADG